MKRLLVAAVAILGVATQAAGRENWFLVGAQTAHFLETASTGSELVFTYMHSPGFTMSSYGFEDGEAVGLFSHSSYLFPQWLSTSLAGGATITDLSFFDLLNQISVILGPGFRTELSETTTLHYGIGVHAMLFAGLATFYNPNWGSTSLTFLAPSFGVGGDIGVKLYLTDRLFLDVGATASIDFLCYVDVSGAGYSVSGFSGPGYSLWSLRPYLGFGMDLHFQYY